MPHRDPNQRRLAELFPTLEPLLSDQVQRAAHAVADAMGGAGWFITRHGRATGVFHLGFSDGRRSLNYSEEELLARAASLAAGEAFPWATDLQLQGQRTD